MIWDGDPDEGESPIMYECLNDLPIDVENPDNNTQAQEVMLVLINYFSRLIEGQEVDEKIITLDKGDKNDGTILLP